MDREVALTVLAEALALWRQKPYGWLVERIGHEENQEVTASDGRRYEIELQAFWDDEPGGVVRVLGTVDDGGWRAFVPLARSFLASPDGEIDGP